MRQNGKNLAPTKNKNSFSANNQSKTSDEPKGLLNKNEYHSTKSTPNQAARERFLKESITAILKGISKLDINQIKKLYRNALLYQNH